MKKSTFLAGGLLAIAGIAQAAFWDSPIEDKKIKDGLITPMLVAVPNDPNTSIVQVFDPNDPAYPFFPLLLTENTGYQIECSNIPKLKGMFTGLGFDPDMLAWMEQVPLDDSRVVSSGYELNPSLHCDTSAQLLSVDFPNETKYFLDLDGLNSNKVNHIGCQGLLDAMGYDINNAASMPLNIFSIYFNAADANDIHCMDGVPVGETGSCGDYANGESWDQMISHGTQTYMCIDGSSVAQGDPSCDPGYDPVNGQCVDLPDNCGSHQHGSIWSESIPNGSQSYSCNDGTITAVGSPTCNPGFELSGNQCIDPPDNCYHDGSTRLHGSSWIVAITNGTRSYSCNDGSVIPGAISCSNGYNWDGSKCAYVPKACTSPVTGSLHAHGANWTDGIPNGSRSFSCNDGSVTNTANTCDTQHEWNGSSCVYIPQQCISPVTGATHNHNTNWSDPISHGTRSFNCNDGTVTNTSNECDTQYTWNGTACNYVPKNCGSRLHGATWSESISNGDVTKKCNDGVTSITSTTCDSHYKVSGVGQCTYEYYSCGSHAHGSTWTQWRTATGGAWCEPPEYRDSYRCDDGTSIKTGTETIFAGIPRRNGWDCP